MDPATTTEMTEEERLNQEAFDLVYGKDEEEPATTAESETPAVVETETETEGAAESAEGEPAVETTEGEAEEPLATAEPDYRALYEQLSQKVDSLMQQQPQPALDEEVRRLVSGDKGEKAPEQKIVEAAPKATPTADPLGSLIREHLSLSQPLPFLRDASENERYMSGDPEFLNLLGTRIVNTAVERAVRAAARIIPPVVHDESNRTRIVEKLWELHPYLLPHKSEVANVIAATAGRNPQLSLKEVIEQTLPTLQQKYKTTAPVSTRPAAAQAARRGPAVRTGGGRFQGVQPVEANDSGLQAWLDAKEKGQI